MNKSRKAVFVDRDGVININRDDYVKTVDELQIIPEIVPPLKKLKENNFVIVVITNQSAINRGLTTHEKVNQIHFTIQQFLEKHSVSIDRFYYCPHKPDENCECRKPKPGLLLRAIRELHIDSASSWLVGDRDSDIEAGKAVGCTTIKIEKNFGLKDAVEQILGSHN
jgi:histidinol-phosphate phosphatase family protein